MIKNSMQSINLICFFIFALSCGSSAYSMKITEQNFPPELREALDYAQNSYWDVLHSISKLSQFFASEAWHARADKQLILELFLQNAAIRHEPEVLSLLFEHGARMDLHKRADHPVEFEGFYRIASTSGQHAFHSLGEGNIFHLILELPHNCPIQCQRFMLHRFLLCPMCTGQTSKISKTDPNERVRCFEQRGIKTSSLLSFKCMAAQALQEEVQKESYIACMNTLSLCMSRKNKEHNNVFCKDVRNIIRRYASIMLLENIPATQEIVEKGCMNVIPALKKMLSYRAGVHKDVMPYQVVEFSWRSRNSIQDFKIVEYLSSFSNCPIEPACEEELWSLLDPKNVYATVEHIAREQYPEFDITIDAPNSWGVWKLFGNSLNRLPEGEFEDIS
jgi:hypothetical protein